MSERRKALSYEGRFRLVLRTVTTRPKTLSDALQFPRFSKQGEGGIALAIAKRAFARAKRD